MLPRLLVVILLWSRTVSCDCPRLCECKWKGGKESVVCLNANLTLVPLHLDRGTQIIDLTGNNVAGVKRDEFSQAGLLNLQKVFMPKCRLRSLDRYAFRYLKNLVELDLSDNELKEVPSHALGSIPELRELKLNGNPIEEVKGGAFASVPQLIRLEISYCKLVSIQRSAFSGLETSLEWLKIDNNQLQTVNANAFTPLHNLHGLELAGNPWNCSCTLRPLRLWMLKQNVPFGIPPTCNTPARLSQKPWSKLDLDEFACLPEILAPTRKTEGIEGKNVTITCTIAGIPEPSVHWLLKNKPIPTTTDARKTYVVRSERNTSDLTILTADAQDAGVYVCAAENKAGRAEASVTLAVARKPPEQNLRGKFLYASVVAGSMLAVASCLTLLCVYSSRKTHTRWRDSECEDSNYEKIEMNKHVNGAPRGEIAVVGSLRRNGEYRVVPDADQEEDEEGNFVAGKVWEDQQDLHIPRRDARDDFKDNCSSTSGTFSAASTAPRYTPGFERKYPDLLDSSQKKATSEGGSVGDLTDFCTLPRKLRPHWRSTDSQSPLLPESRSSTNSSHRNLNSTPLLDVSGLDNRVQFNPKVVTSCASSPVNAYDYHAAQLEHFLEEYRSLQKELTRMKETCDSIRQERVELGGHPVAAQVANRNSQGGVLGFLSCESELTRYLLSEKSETFKN